MGRRQLRSSVILTATLLNHQNKEFILNLYSILIALFTLIAAPAAHANTNSEITEDVIALEAEELTSDVSEDEISEEIIILDNEKEYAEWLDYQESVNADTVYVDEDGNEYYIAEEQVAGGGTTLRKKRSGPRAQKRNCSARNGGASWYGPGFHGRKTANGETFNQNALTAAHKTLKFGTIVRVTYKGKSVNVRINDAGPYSGGRVIDLSKAAASKIGLIGAGHGNVTLEVVSCGK